MSTLIKPADTPTIPVTDGANGSVTVGGTTLSAAQAGALKDHWAGANQIIVAPPAPFLTLFLFCKALITTCVASSRMAAVTSFGNVLTFFSTFLGLGNLPKIKKKGAPTQAGCVAAIRAAVDTVTAFPTETANAHVKPTDLSAQGDDLEAWWALQTLLTTCLEKIDRNAIPEAKTAVGEMRQIVTVVDPILDTHSDVALKMKPALTYLKDPFIKGAKTRKANKRKDKKITTEVQNSVMPQARAQARQEVTTQVNDALAGLFNPGTSAVSSAAGSALSTTATTTSRR